MGGLPLGMLGRLSHSSVSPLSPCWIQDVEAISICSEVHGGPKPALAWALFDISRIFCGGGGGYSGCVVGSGRIPGGIPPVCVGGDSRSECHTWSDIHPARCRVTYRDKPVLQARTHTHIQQPASSSLPAYSIAHTTGRQGAAII